MKKDEKILNIDKISVILPERLKYFRLKRNLSLREVANKIDKSPSQISFWERGINPPSCIDLFKLCVIYNITLSDLFPAARNNIEPLPHEIEIIYKYRSADEDVRNTIKKILEYTQDKKE